MPSRYAGRHFYIRFLPINFLKTLSWNIPAIHANVNLENITGRRNT